MSKLKLDFELIPGGVEIYLTEETKAFLRKAKTQKINVSEWDLQTDMQLMSGLAKLQAVIQQDESEQRAVPRVSVLEHEEGYFITHELVAQLSDVQATSLGLPLTAPFQLRITTTGPLLEASTKITPRWYTAARPVSGEQIGAFLVLGQEYYRVPEPSFSALKAIGEFNSFNDGSLDDRLAKLAGLRGILGGEGGDSPIDLEKRLRDLRISHATSFSLDLRQEQSGLEFDPLLFSQDVVKTFEETGEQVTDSANVLTNHQQSHFSKGLFQRYAEARSAYVIDSNTYVFIDPALRPALNIVREAQSSNPEEKSKFVKNPAAFIKERLLDGKEETPELTEALERLFIETTGYSERVQSLGIWTPKPIPWLKREGNSWVPEKFGLKIGESTITLSNEMLDHAIERVQAAITEHESMVVVDADQAAIPANEDSLTALKQLQSHVQELAEHAEKRAAEEENGANDEPDDEQEEKLAPSRHVLILEDNVEILQFMSQFKPRASYCAPEVPSIMRFEPKPHQIEGVGWLQECWCKGFPGVLLADDMGLGKTYQTLGFLSWLQNKRAALALPRQPILIVAPTSLLANWRDEEVKHLNEPGLRAQGILYGSELKSFKEPGASNDVKMGRATLDLTRIRECDWLLTTYETLRDFHISLAAIKFSCVVFDEMQRVKNPGSLNTHASKALNADFTLGLTGTPIENSLADLWCILDTLTPGLLGDLKSFVKSYPEDDHEQLKLLHTKLLTRTPETPAPLLRRMKSDISEGLPAKIESVVDSPMRGVQERTYNELIADVKAGRIKPGLQFLHGIRMVSLHPHAPGSASGSDINTYIAESARLKTTFELLDQIHAKREKALVFLESIDLQEWLAYAIKLRYQLAKLPARIYGDIAADERKRIVDRFQESPTEFAVMILSPKAGGVGLTITAATNVIHLSRWWNPAVEDQCTDRAYRIGQTKEVRVYYPRAIHPLYPSDSFDVVLHDLLMRKRELSKNMLIPMEGKRDVEFMMSRVATKTE